MKLELKHLAPYLPYGLKIRVFGQTRFKDYNCEIEGLHKYGQAYFSQAWSNIDNSGYFKPILRPMVDFDDPEKYNGDHYSFMSELNSEMPNDIQIDRDLEFDIERDCFLHCKYAMQVYDFMFENHFDVFGLIDAGLAIDINQTNPDQGH